MNARRLLLAVGLAAAAVLAWRLRTPARGTPTDVRPAAGAVTATYTGAETCAACHQQAYAAWRTSQHHDAMQPASRESVKGRFEGDRFRYDDIVSTFFQRDGRFWVRTDGPDGRPTDFEVKYTFGVSPLQQYLLELPGGRLQALSIAWDARPANAGGQRWFHLYPGQHVAHGDELHWTGRQQNWNFMCADCHSTNVRKNYDPAGGTFRTAWSELNVACEACHGPGSRHVAWARETSAAARAAARDNGLTVHLTERRGVAWTNDPRTMIPVRSAPRTTSREIDVCAPCHSRRAPLAEGYAPGAPLLDFYDPAPLEASLYYADGQQREEVYTYASFLQSRMAQAGVTCSDCHEPHAGTLRAAGNALCTRCHAPARYDTPAHHHHQPSAAGAACVECHMPARTYMRIDPRRDHSLRVPRPDLSVSLGVPNACTECHANRPAAWAASAVREWLGRDATGFQDFAGAFHDAEAGRPDARGALLRIATSSLEPPIVRASAFDRLAAVGASASDVSPGLHDADPLVRQRALGALDAAAPAGQAAVAVPLLSDTARAVRVAAARLLASSAAQLAGADRVAFDRASTEVAAAARVLADRPESHLSYGVFLSDQGRTREAEAEYRAAIRLAADFPPAYVNLAELLRTEGDEPGAEKALRGGLAANPASPDLHYALGLSLTRSHRAPEALDQLKRASELAPTTGRFVYAYALALHDAGQPDTAMRALVAALAQHPADREILFALASFERDAGRVAAARQHAADLVAAYPQDAEARALLQSLRDRQP